MRCESRIAVFNATGDPEDAPQSMRTRYPDDGGFYRQVGDVAGMDVIGIPMKTVNAEMASSGRSNLTITAISLLLLLGSILLAFRAMVGHRLSTITAHFHTTAAQAGELPTESRSRHGQRRDQRHGGQLQRPGGQTAGPA